MTTPATPPSRQDLLEQIRDLKRQVRDLSTAREKAASGARVLSVIVAIGTALSLLVSYYATSPHSVKTWAEAWPVIQNGSVASLALFAVVMGTFPPNKYRAVTDVAMLVVAGAALAFFPAAQAGAIALVITYVIALASDFLTPAT